MPHNADAGNTSLHAGRLVDLITASWAAQAAHAAAEFRLADLLADGPRSSADLAAAAGCHEPSLHRLLRAMVTIGLCTQTDDGRFAVTPMGAMLSENHPSSLRAWAIWWGRYLWPTWGELLYSVRTGRSARAAQTGTEGFGHLERDPAAAEVFNRALVELTRLATASILRAYDFSSFRRIVDVGGGHGELLAAILRASPESRGVLFDLPHAIPGARRHLEEAGVAGRCETVAGDFFESVPTGGDAYILKTVIHDWPDDAAARILATCRRAMASGSARLLIIDRVMPERLGPGDQGMARSDLTMLIAHAGMERTAEQFRALLAAAGLGMLRVVPAGVLSIIEAAAGDGAGA